MPILAPLALPKTATDQIQATVMEMSINQFYEYDVILVSEK